MLVETGAMRSNEPLVAGSGEATETKPATLRETSLDGLASKRVEVDSRAATNRLLVAKPDDAVGTAIRARMWV